MSTTTCLALLPRDGVFSKDARGWYTSESGRGRALDWPWPSTLLGALRGAWGRVYEARHGRALVGEDWRMTERITLAQSLLLRRPVGAHFRDEHRVWPVPVDAFWPEPAPEQAETPGKVGRLDPRPSNGAQTLGHDDDEARAALWQPRLEGRAKPGDRPVWWHETEFMAWLAGGPVAVRPKREWLTLPRRTQTHVRLQRETQTAEQGMLFAHEVVETLVREPHGEPTRGAPGSSVAEWGMGVAIACNGVEALFDVTSPPPLHFGSNGRIATAQAVSPALFEPSPQLCEAFRGLSRGLRLVVVSAACFANGWRPDGLERKGGEFRGRLGKFDVELVLRAALIPRPVHASGWDMLAGKPKPIARLVPPGSVYFFERADGRPFDETSARDLWLMPLGGRSDEGFGRVVPGIWNPQRGLTEMKTRAFLMHALSPLHAGVGHADDIVDLPTARTKASGLPFVPGSSIKGVLRDDCEERATSQGAADGRDGERVLATFGPPTDDSSAHAGALIVGDARLLAMPVRSFRGTFAWVSSPLLLALAKRDLTTAEQGLEATLPNVPTKPGRWALRTTQNDCDYEGTLYLEDLDLPLTRSAEIDKWAAFLTRFVYPDGSRAETIFTRRFVVVDDDTMSFFCETALQIDARVRLNPDTRTVAQGALWLEESLPPETLLLGLLAADRSRRKAQVMSPDDVLDFALSRGGTTLQFGGHATIGRGRCRVAPMLREERAST